MERTMADDNRSKGTIRLILGGIIAVAAAAFILTGGDLGPERNSVNMDRCVLICPISSDCSGWAVLYLIGCSISTEHRHRFDPDQWHACDDRACRCRFRYARLQALVDRHVVGSRRADPRS